MVEQWGGRRALHNPAPSQAPAPKVCLFFQPFELRPWSRAKGGRERLFETTEIRFHPKKESHGGAGRRGADLARGCRERFWEDKYWVLSPLMREPGGQIPGFLCSIFCCCLFFVVTSPSRELGIQKPSSSFCSGTGHGGRGIWEFGRGMGNGGLSGWI